MIPKCSSHVPFNQSRRLARSFWPMDTIMERLILLQKQFSLHSLTFTDSSFRKLERRSEWQMLQQRFHPACGSAYSFHRLMCPFSYLEIKELASKKTNQQTTMCTKRHSGKFHDLQSNNLGFGLVKSEQIGKTKVYYWVDIAMETVIFRDRFSLSSLFRS